MTRKRGPDLTGVTFDVEGTPHNTYSRGPSVDGTPSSEVVARQMNRSIAVHSFLKRKRRLWPTPRI